MRWDREDGESGLRPHVLHFTSNAAASPYFRMIAEHTDRSRVRLSMGTLSPAGPLHAELRDRDTPALALGCRARRQYPWAAVQLAAWLRSNAVDVIQTHLYDAGVVGLVAARLAGTPLAVLTRHHSTAVVLTGKQLPALIDRVCSRWLANRVIAVSDVVRRFVVGTEKVPGRYVAVVPYGVEPDRFAPPPGTRERVRRDLGAGDAVVAVVVGRLDPLKGHALLFEAVRGLAPAHPRLRLWVVGDGPERPRLEALRDALGLAGVVGFLGFRSDVPDLYHAADLLVHPSLTEAFCQVLLEAAICGKPIVTTDIGGARDVIEDRLTGVIVPPSDSAALAAGLDAVLQLSAYERARMGEQGRERAKQFTPQAMVKAYEEHYVRWLGERGAN
jgi:glycosyltransferase involved in cell wall biosynthesis